MSRVDPNDPEVEEVVANLRLQPGCIGIRVQAGFNGIKFTLVKEISALESTLTNYLYEAVALEESGKKVALRKPTEYPIPEELQTRLDDDLSLGQHSEALTPGRRKSYISHVAGAKQAITRAARVEKCVPRILSGREFNELPE